MQNKYIHSFQMVTALALSCMSLIVANFDIAQADDDFVCAAVVPCDQDGKVLPGFDSGPCADVYNKICQAQQANKDATELNKCMSDNGKYQDQIRFLKRLNKRLAAKLPKSSASLRVGR